MNATTFFTRDMFDKLKEAVANEEIINPTNNPYGRTLRVNGNTYKVMVCAGRYYTNDEYYVSLWYDYNYPGPYQSRTIGGGSGGAVNLSSWEAFKGCINNILCKWPDYKVEEEYPEQISLFDL